MISKIPLKNYFPGTLVAGVVFFMLWFLLSNSGFISRTLIATPAEVWQTVEQAFSQDASISEKFHLHAWATIERALGGWTVAGFFGIVGGIAVGNVARAYDASEVLTEFVRAIPPILLFPLMLVAFNYGEGAYHWTVVVGCFPIMFLTIAKGTASIERQRIEFLNVAGANKLTTVFAQGMEIMPSVFLGSRLTLATALTIAVVTEMIFSPRNGMSLGALARDAEIDFNTPMFYTSIITIGLFGYFSNYFLRKIEFYFSPKDN